MNTSRFLQSLAVVAILGNLTSAHIPSFASESAEQQLAQLFQTLPAEVKEHISKAENCQKFQWTAPPELTKSMKCSKLSFDNSRLQSKYDGDANVQHSLELTRDLYFDAPNN